MKNIILLLTLILIGNSLMQAYVLRENGAYLAPHLGPYKIHYTQRLPSSDFFDQLKIAISEMNPENHTLNGPKVTHGILAPTITPDAITTGDGISQLDYYHDNNRDQNAFTVYLLYPTEPLYPQYQDADIVINSNGRYVSNFGNTIDNSTLHILTHMRHEFGHYVGLSHGPEYVTDDRTYLNLMYEDITFNDVRPFDDDSKYGFECLFDGVCDHYEEEEEEDGSGSDKTALASTQTSNPNTYYTGYLAGTVAINDNTRQAIGSQDILLSKSNAKGVEQWVKLIGGTGDDYGKGITLDAHENIYTTGYYSSNFTFDHIKVKHTDAEDLYLAKLNKDGDLQWVQTAQGARTDMGNGITVDKEGFIYVVGSFTDQLTFQNQTIHSFEASESLLAELATLGDIEINLPVFPQGEQTINITEALADYKQFSDIFIAKYAPNGDVVWVETAGGIGPDVGESIVVDQDGNIVVSGYYTAVAATFGGYPLVHHGVDETTLDAEGFVAKYTPDGDLIWVNSIYGSGLTISASIAITPNNEIVVGGHFKGDIFLNRDIRQKASDYDGFVAKYAASGQALWLEPIRGTGLTKVKSVVVDEYANIMVNGEFHNELHLANKSKLQSQSGSDLFFIQYDKDAQYLWSKREGGAADDITYMTYSGNGRYQYTGCFMGEKPTTLEGVTLEAQDGVMAVPFEQSFSVWAKPLNAEGYATSFILDYIGANPFTTTTTLQINSQYDKILTLHIFDINGKLMHTQTSSVQAGQNQVSVHLEPYTAGMYFVKVSDGQAFTAPLKLVKQ